MFWTAETTVKVCIRQDRAEGIHAIAHMYQQCAEAGDSKGLFRTVRILSGKQTASGPGLRLEDGSMAFTALDKAKRWQQHFRDLLGGEITDIRSIQGKVLNVNADALTLYKCCGQQQGELCTDGISHTLSN